jgi:hypothetical protein
MIHSFLRPVPFLVAILLPALSLAAPRKSQLQIQLERLPAITVANDATACARDLLRWNTEFAATTPAQLKVGESQTLLQNLFELRRAVGKMTTRIEQQSSLESVEGEKCLAQIRQTLVALRSGEDELILMKGQNGVDQALQGAYPQLLTIQGAASKVRLRSGDVLLSRGNAFVSAAIARISGEQSQFSHLTQVYIDAPVGTEISAEAAISDPRVYTIEAHIEVGSFTRPFKNYVTDGNARVVQYRSKLPPAQAHAAARFIFEKVRAYQTKSMEAAGRKAVTVNDNPPYDFKMNLDDESEIFCAEVISVAYRSVGVQVPQYPSETKQNDVTKRLGITAKTTFAPADIEIDPNFVLVAEWREFKKLAATKSKDVVFDSIYGWMKKLNYAYHPSTADEAKAAFSWSVRQSDAALLDRLPKNMSTTTIAMTFVLDRVGEVLEKRVMEATALFQKKSGGLRPNEFLLLKDLEGFRANDEARFRNGYGTAFHWDLR